MREAIRKIYLIVDGHVCWRRSAIADSLRVQFLSFYS